MIRPFVLASAFVMGCAPAAPAPAAEVPVAAVNAGPAGTAAPPIGATQLPSSLIRRRPMTDRECRDFLANMIDSALTETGIADPTMRAERRAGLMKTMEGDLERCRQALVTDPEAKCLLQAPSPEAVERCHQE